MAIFGHFGHFFPIKIPIKTSHGWPRGIYGSINLKKFMEPNSSAGKYKVIPIFLYLESNILEDKVITIFMESVPRIKYHSKVMWSQDHRHCMAAMLVETKDDVKQLPSEARLPRKQIKTLNARHVEILSNVRLWNRMEKDDWAGDGICKPWRNISWRGQAL